MFFPLQQGLRERALMLRYTCSAHICYERSKPWHKLRMSWRTRAKMNVHLHVK